MEILFLCHRIPYPPNKGDKIRSHALLTHLARHHRIHVACFVDDPADLIHRDEVRQIARGECVFVPLPNAKKWIGAARACVTGKPVTTSYLFSRSITRWISRLTARIRIDRTVAYSSGMAPYVLKHPGLDPSRAILDMVDVDSDKWRQYAERMSAPESWIFRREAAKLARFERKAAQNFAATLFVSDYEAQTFAAIAPESSSRIVAVPNGVDVDRFSLGEFPNPFSSGELPIVMTGQMDYWPNVEGVEWFLREIMPNLKSQLPNARFFAIGANPPASWRKTTNSFVAKAVADVRPYIHHAAAVVAPLRIARGVQNKVLEAMAMEKSIVATHEATRALAVTSGIELLVENDAVRFANAVVSAISRNDMGPKARDYVERHHNWEHNLGAVDRCLAFIGRTLPEQFHIREVSGSRSTSSIAETAN